MHKPPGVWRSTILTRQDASGHRARFPTNLDHASRQDCVGIDVDLHWSGHRPSWRFHTIGTLRRSVAVQWQDTYLLDHQDSCSDTRRDVSERPTRSEEHTSELQSRGHLVCRLLLEKKNKNS